MIQHTALTLIANEIKNEIDKLSCFKNVTVCHASSWHQIIQSLEHVAGSPKALVCLGSGNYEDFSTTRKFQISVICVQQFGVEFWNLIEAIENLFIVQKNTLGEFLFFHTDSGAMVALSDWALAETEDNNTYAIITLNIETYAFNPTITGV